MVPPQRRGVGALPRADDPVSDNMPWLPGAHAGRGVEAGSRSRSVASGASVASRRSAVAEGIPSWPSPPTRPVGMPRAKTEPEQDMQFSSVARGDGASTGGAVSSSSSCSGSNITCDRCDGKHATDRCPVFHKERERHKDAWVNYGRKGGPLSMGSSGGNFVLKSARVMRQPGDGSCLFHSLNHGLNSGASAPSLRREIAGFLMKNPTLQIAGDTLEEWVRWDSNSSVNDYARRIAVSGWGGGIEMACCSIIKNVNVHVYETSRCSGVHGEFKRISCFDTPNAEKTVHVLYQGGVHYDALQPLVS